MILQPNPFVYMNSSKDRLGSWKEIRNSAKTLDDAAALKLVAEYWGSSPVSNFSYRPDLPEEWPTPWEMVSRGDWCRSMLAVAMEITLRLSDWDENRLKLVYIRDYDISEEVLILKIDEQYALNYSIGEVTNYPNTNHVITGSWQFRNKKYVDLFY